jgi:uncharacterized protein YcgI (DUF1989 family)
VSGLAKGTSVLVPAATARSVHAPAGATVRITDVQGGQVGDMFVLAADDPAEHLSAAHTRLHGGSLFPEPGECFYSSARRPLLRFLRDTSPGRHDMLIPACDAERYRQLGATEHPSCSANFQRCLAEMGLPGQPTPQPVNIFMPVSVAGDGSLTLEAAPSRPGDLVELEALRDVLVVVAACSQDLTDTNNFSLTELLLEVIPAPVG